MNGRKDAFTDVAQALQGQNNPAPVTPNPIPQNLAPNQVVNNQGEVINLGFNSHQK